MRLFLNLFFIIIIFNISIFSEELNMLDIKMKKIEKELSLNEEQKAKMLEVIKQENEELKRPVIRYDVINDSLDKIIKIEKEDFEKKENVLKEFLRSDQLKEYQNFKSDSIRENLTLFLSKGLEFDDRQSLLLDTFTPVAVKKMFMIKGNISRNYEPSDDVIKKINELLSIYEKEVVKILNPSQKKLYDDNRKNIMQFIIKDILGFEDKKEGKGIKRKTNDIPGGISF